VIGNGAVGITPEEMLIRDSNTGCADVVIRFRPSLLDGVHTCRG
jgi:hypothetical protein